MLDFAKALRNLIDQIDMNLQIMTTLAYSSSWHAHDLRPEALVRKATQNRWVWKKSCESCKYKTFAKKSLLGEQSFKLSTVSVPQGLR